MIVVERGRRDRPATRNDPVPFLIPYLANVWRSLRPPRTATRAPSGRQHARAHTLIVGDDVGIGHGAAHMGRRGCSRMRGASPYTLPGRR